ncbi:hypothetical protein TNCV_1051051 [Trichonephila clavipes]|nr:hypothetical protein TNCV_1051051 [Trichonephila clavipes]
MRKKLEVIPDGIIKHTVVYTDELIHGTDSNQEDIMNISIITWCDSMEGNSSTVKLRQFVQHNRLHFRPPRNDENIQRQG